jgi:hypothetical protein
MMNNANKTSNVIPRARKGKLTSLENHNKRRSKAAKFSSHTAKVADSFIKDGLNEKLSEEMEDMGFSVPKLFPSPDQLREVGHGSRPVVLECPINVKEPLPQPAPRPFVSLGKERPKKHPEVVAPPPKPSLKDQVARKAKEFRLPKPSNDCGPAKLGRVREDPPPVPPQPERVPAPFNQGLTVTWHESMWIFTEFQDVLWDLLKMALIVPTALSALALGIIVISMALQVQLSLVEITSLLSFPTTLILILMSSLVGVVAFSKSSPALRAAFGYKHEFVFGQIQRNGSAGDKRSELMKNVDISQNDPLITPVHYTKYLFGFWAWHQQTFSISSALLADVCVARNLNPNSTDQLAFDRIVFGTDRHGYLNLDRWAQVLGEPIAQQTSVVGFALFRQNAEKLRHLPFPRPQSV